MKAGLARLQDEYASAFERYLSHGDESGLRAAYELGRLAIREQLSVMDLASLHHTVLASSLSPVTRTEEVEAVTRAATAFFLESLSAFEMVQRGYWEATRAAQLERDHAAQLRQLADASLRINAVLSLESILQELADRSRSIVGARCAMAEAVGGDPRTPASRAVSFAGDDGAWQEVANVAGSLMGSWLSGALHSARMGREELKGLPEWKLLRTETGPTITRLLGAALVGREDRALGHIVLFDGDEEAFSEKDEAILAQLAGVASVATQNARLYEREHNVAETLQRRLLPERLPEIPGFELAARYLPGTVGIEVGGDWYDVLPLPGDRVGIAVGDVLGRGARAASLMGQVRTAFHAYALSGDPPHVVAGRMDELIQAMGLGHFSTMVYVALEPSHDEVQVVRAGHPPPLVLGPGGTARYVEGGLGLPLGVLPGEKYASVPERVEPGSIIVLYTDGLVESTEGLERGFARLKASVERGPDDLDTLADHVLREMVGATVDDDVALLMVRLGRGASPVSR